MPRGVRAHAWLLRVGQSDSAGIPSSVWFMFFPISVTDLALSFGADLVLLPVLGPRAWVKAAREAQRASLPPPPEQRAEAKRAALTQQAFERVANEAWVFSST